MLSWLPLARPGFPLETSCIKMPWCALKQVFLSITTFCSFAHPAPFRLKV
jgi:hypothetical protein